MTTVKIISNPYDKKIMYYRQNQSSGEWMPINYSNNPNSALLRTELTDGFFPFVVDKIVDAILTEYGDENGRVAVVFEGTEDEYEELALVCADDSRQGAVELSRSDRYLENARDVLPDVIDIFKELRPVIIETVKDRSKIQNELEKFSDAANDIIPICVMGNYSSGKSTFINALIGNEIMPSGDEPVTAKIYRVSRSKQNDRAYVSFTYDDEDIKVRFDSKSYSFVQGESDKELIIQIKQALGTRVSRKSGENKSSVAESQAAVKPVAVLASGPVYANADTVISDHVHKMLTVINNFENMHKDARISDLIKVSIPFHGGLWNQSPNEFVIFDTPGSNSASNDKHMQVLKKAMEDLSNGLPVFISEYNTLDSTDNEKLNQEIKSMPELDSRFTMIIVNKADAASLPKDGFSEVMTERLLGEAIPRSLYSEGIFFVSSVIGLGAKTKGHFLDEHNSEVFDDQEEKYEDPENRRYKRLFLYDIMPGKQKEHAIDAANTCEDLLFVNSGLFTVEQEIQTFANKYSSYNKCQQSRRFLGKVIDITSEEIALAKKDREETRQKSEEKLEEDKKALIAQIQEKGNQLVAESKESYPHVMEDPLAKIHDMYYQESLDDEQQAFMEQERQNRDAENYERNATDSAHNVGENLTGNVKELVKTPSLMAVKNIGKNLYTDTKNAWSRRKELQTLQREMDKSVSDQLVQMINHDFRNYCTQAQTILNMQSADYWSAVAVHVKEELVKVVTGSSALSEEKKTDLSEVIVSYQGINFDEQDEEIFVKADYEYRIKLFNHVFGHSEKLKLEKLRERYNSEMEQAVNTICTAIEASHENSMDQWIQNLFNVITENIVSYNPDLRAQQQFINRETERINDLENKQKKVYRYSEEIRRKMEWKEA